jgi:hypothetical protein
MAGEDVRIQLVRVRALFWIECVLASISGALLLLTVLWHDWLEALGLNLDGGNGSAEWLIVGLLAGCSLALALAARVEWRKSSEVDARPVSSVVRSG